MSSTKFLRFSIVFGLLCLSAVLRFSNAGEIFSRLFGHINLLDPDSFYQFRRLVSFLENFPEVMKFDPLADWPAGHSVDWAEGFVWIFGLPLKLFGVSSFQSLEVATSLMHVGLGVFTCWLVYRLAKKLELSFDTQLIVLFMAAISPMMIRYSTLGQVDHHVIELLMVPLVLGLLVSGFSANSTSRVAAAGIFLMIYLTTSSSVVFLLVVCQLVIAFELSKERLSRLWWVFQLSFLLPALAFVIFRHDSSRGTVDFFQASYFHLAIFIYFGGLGALLVQIRHRRWGIWTVTLVIPSLMMIFNWPSTYATQLRWAFLHLIGQSSVLSNVLEAKPIFMDLDGVNFSFVYGNLGYLAFLLPVFPLLLFLKNLSPNRRAILWAATLLAIPGILQKRFCHLLVVPYLLSIGILLEICWAWMKQKQLRIGPAIGIFCGGLMLGPALEFGFAPRMLPMHEVDFSLMVLFQKKLGLDEKTVWNRLAGKLKSEDGILANPNMGHMLNYVTGLPVVTNSFYHPQSMTEDLEIRLLTSDEELLTRLRKNKIRYIFVAEDPRYFEFILKNQGRPYEYLRFFDKNLNQKVWDMDQFLKLAWYRLIFKEQLPKGFNELVSFSTPTPHFYRRVRILEVLPKAS